MEIKAITYTEKEHIFHVNATFYLYMLCVQYVHLLENTRRYSLGQNTMSISRYLVLSMSQDHKKNDSILSISSAGAWRERWWRRGKRRVEHMIYPSRFLMNLLWVAKLFMSLIAKFLHASLPLLASEPKSNSARRNTHIYTRTRMHNYTCAYTVTRTHLRDD